MIKIENYEVMGWDHAIRGMRNPKNSWDKSDSGRGCSERKDWTGTSYSGALCKHCGATYESHCVCNAVDGPRFIIGPNDLDLMKRLRNAGTDHRKFMRMIVVYVDITAPLYWWKEFDTYKVGTVANSCSTMHKLTEKPFEWSDFSFELLMDDPNGENSDTPLIINPADRDSAFDPADIGALTIFMLNACRQSYLTACERLKQKNWTDAERKHIEAQKELFWYQMIQLLNTSYNQKRTVCMNYEVLANQYKSRKNHKLREWRKFCEWIKTLPYSELITGEEG